MNLNSDDYYSRK